MARTIALMAAIAITAGCIPKTDAGTAQAPRGSMPEEEAPTLDIAGSCKADGLQRYMGKALTPALAEQMQKEAGAKALRTAHENGMITMDYNSGRLNIFHDDANRIVRVNCG